MSLKTMEDALAAAAAAEWAKIVAEGKVVLQSIESAGETFFETVSKQFAPLVMSTISDLATSELASLSGNEKTNLAATTVVQGAAAQGVALLAEDVTAMIKNGFEAFKTTAPNLLPSGQVADAAASALDAGEQAVEKLVGEGVAAAGSAINKI